MKVASGAVLIVAGVWALTQVLGGNALGRLGVTGAPTTTGGTTSTPSTTQQAPGPPTGTLVAPGVLQ